MPRQLDEQVSVSGQIQPADVAALKEQGITAIINNRPDGEDAGQPLGADIEAAAEAAGITYRSIPIYRGIGPGHVEEMRQAFDAHLGQRVLAFCRSGTRSALAWAVARCGHGMSRDEVEERASRAGVDLAPIAHLL